MKLDFAELQAIAYVYHPDKDKSYDFLNFVYSQNINAIQAYIVFDILMLMVLCHSKRLVSSRGIEAYRADFDTLTPGNMINHKVLQILVFLKFTCITNE
jgi:hypothetical protein